MRGSQSDPTHTHAPVCTCLRTLRALCAGVGWARRACANTTGLLMLSSRAFAPFWCGRFSGPRRRRSVWLGHWPRRGLLGALAGLLGALLGLCVWRGMLGRRGRLCDACFHWLNPQYCEAIQYQWYALSVWLRVWPRLGRACPKRMA